MKRCTFSSLERFIRGSLQQSARFEIDLRAKKTTCRTLSTFGRWFKTHQLLPNLFWLFSRLDSNRDVESHKWAGRNILAGPLWEKIVDFFLWKWRILVYLFLSDGGAPKRRGTRGNLPPSLDGSDSN